MYISLRLCLRNAKLRHNEIREISIMNVGNGRRWNSLLSASFTEMTGSVWP